MLFKYVAMAKIFNELSNVMWRWSAGASALSLKIINIFSYSHRKYCNKRTYNVLFFGTDKFSLTSLKKIHQEYISKGIVNKLEVVTNVKSNNCVMKYAKNNNIPMHNWPISTNFIHNFHLGVVVSFGYLIPSKIINSFPLGILNVHASLLPRWRGAAPIIHCLLNGDTHTGITIMRIKPKHFDIGDIINQKEIEINGMFQPELYNNLANLGANILIETLYDLPNYLNNAKPQDSSIVSKASKIDSSLAIINWEKCSALQIHNQSRALLGIFPLVTQYKGKTIFLNKLHLWNEKATDADLKIAPGHFEFMKLRKVIRVCCSDHNYVYFDTIKVKGKPEMKVLDFRNGFMKKTVNEQLKFDSL